MPEGVDRVPEHVLDGLAAEFALAAARATRLLPGLAGVPAPVRLRVAAEPVARASALVVQVGRLRQRLADTAPTDTDTSGRARLLDAQLRALECTVRGLAGQPVRFRDEVRTLFGVGIEAGEPDGYADAHRAVGALLPGRGPVLRRWAEHRRREAVPAALLLAAVRALAAALRARLPWAPPAGATVLWRVVDHAPWSALHTEAHAPHCSVVTLNAGAGLRWSELPALVAHEACPGHHMQATRPVRRPEDAVALVRGPRSVIAEGAAEAGLELLVGPAWGGWAADVLAQVVRDARRGWYGDAARTAAGSVGTAAGVPFEGELAHRLDAAAAPLQAVRQDAALLLHERRLPYPARPAAAREHLLRLLPTTPQRAARVVEALGSPLWRGHVVAHVQGPPLVNGWLRTGAGTPADRYLRLLDDPLLPCDLGREAPVEIDERIAERGLSGAVS